MELLDASKRVTKLCCLTHLTVCVGDLRAAVSIFVVRNLVVDHLPGTELIDLHVNFTRTPKVVLYHTSSVSITGHRCLTKPKAFFNLELENRFQKIRTTRKRTTPPTSRADLQHNVQPEDSALFITPQDLPPKTSP